MWMLKIWNDVASCELKCRGSSFRGSINQIVMFGAVAEMSLLDVSTFLSYFANHHVMCNVMSYDADIMIHSLHNCKFQSFQRMENGLYDILFVQKRSSSQLWKTEGF